MDADPKTLELDKDASRRFMQRPVRRCGSADRFIAKMERSQRVRLQKDMWKLCDENRRLGGAYWKTVLRRFGLKESEIWNDAKTTNQP
jgi:hypothetical protein